MAEEHPTFRCEFVKRPGEIVGVWEGSTQPIQSWDRLLDLLDDLHHDRAVYIAGDEIRHLSLCTDNHCHHEWMSKIGELGARFNIRIAYDGGKIDPRCWVLDPPIPFSKRKHMWGDNAMCPFLSSDKVWLWHTHTVADFLPHALIWLVKWMVYDQTGEWIGAQHDGSPFYHLKNISPKDPCWCGSGEQYRKCHRKEDLLSVRHGVNKRWFERRF